MEIIKTIRSSSGSLLTTEKMENLEKKIGIYTHTLTHGTLLIHTQIFISLLLFKLHLNVAVFIGRAGVGFMMSSEILESSGIT